MRRLSSGRYTCFAMLKDLIKIDSKGSFRVTEKDLAYDRISDKWEGFISLYDTNRRIEVLVDDFLGEKEIRGKKCLDVGCGLGYFSKAILRYEPASLCACDISPKLVEKLSERNPGIHCFIGNILELPSALKGEKFDVVVCSDVIEHTVNPRLATKNLLETVASSGLLSISVPNRKWHWLLRLAIAAGLRRNYEGYENYVHPMDLKTWIQEEGFEILRSEGIHTVPFRLFPKKLLRILDQNLRSSNYDYALNLAILARKR